MRRPIRFDDSLPRLVTLLMEAFGPEAASAGTVLRDSSGRLSFFTAEDLDPGVRERVQARLAAELDSYARPDRILVTPSDPGAGAIREDSLRLRVPVHGITMHVVDHRIVGADWLRPPAPAAGPPPRFVFASLKGGVGRSTALAVVAAHVAARGGRVLAIDLDIEAPGLGSLLLTRDTTPEFGMIDALVENGLGGLDDGFYADMTGASAIASAGRIDVIPAFGRRSIDHPADVLAKLARASVEDIREDGTVSTVLDQVREIVDHLAGERRHDAILVDIRAGLHETTASAVLGLGADVLLFGVDEPQTFVGYAALLAHLSRFVDPTQPMPEWIERLTPVHAKAHADADTRKSFAERWRALVLQWGPIRLGQQAEGDPPVAPDFHNVPWDEAAPEDDAVPAESSILHPLAVLRDERYVGFDPNRTRDLLEERIYRTTFGDLLDEVEAAVSLEDPA
jgi:CO dehydrogenase nickel-insertion accessory protein CooC1